MDTQLHERRHFTLKPSKKKRVKPEERDVLWHAIFTVPVGPRGRSKMVSGTDKVCDCPERKCDQVELRRIKEARERE